MGENLAPCEPLDTCNKSISSIAHKSGESVCSDLSDDSDECTEDGLETHISNGSDPPDRWQESDTSNEDRSERDEGEDKERALKCYDTSELINLPEMELLSCLFSEDPIMMWRLLKSVNFNISNVTWHSLKLRLCKLSQGRIRNCTSLELYPADILLRLTRDTENLERRWEKDSITPPLEDNEDELENISDELREFLLTIVEIVRVHLAGAAQLAYDLLMILGTCAYVCRLHRANVAFGNAWVEPADYMLANLAWYRRLVGDRWAIEADYLELKGLSDKLVTHNAEAIYPMTEDLFKKWLLHKKDWMSEGERNF